MENYNFDKDKFVNIIPEIATTSSLTKFLKENASRLSAYEWLLVSKNPAFSLSAVSDDFLDYLDWEYICSTKQLTEYSALRVLG